MYDRDVTGVITLRDGSVRLPMEMQERLSWRDGQVVVAEEHAGRVVLRPATQQEVADADDAALGEAGARLAAEVWPVEDFSDWERDDA